MIKARAMNICKNIGRIRRRKKLIRGGKDSNLLSTKTIQIQINMINQLRINLRENTPWEKGEGHQSNVGDAKKIACTRIFLIEKTK
jgi:hypothetical protein